ncbi:MAG: DUF1559 domain-containing protein [Planctomycetia bacterium]|nr:DUF1559 domain-containing protein [Planctomycetia bacterium]
MKQDSEVTERAERRKPPLPVQSILKVKTRRSKTRRSFPWGKLFFFLTVGLLVGILAWEGRYFYRKYYHQMTPNRVEESLTNMTRILYALNEYRQVHGHYPPAYFTNDRGEPTVSWRVLILPFIKDRYGHASYEDLYRKFHLQESWEHPENQALIPLMPPVYLSPISTMNIGDGRTNYVTIRHPDSVFPGEQAISLGEISDPLEKTVAVLEVADEQCVWWTQPTDFVYDPLEQLSASPVLTHHREGIVCGMCDGTSFFGKVKADPRVVLFRASSSGENLFDDAQLIRLNPWWPYFLRNNGTQPPKSAEEKEAFDPSLYELEGLPPD